MNTLQRNGTSRGQAPSGARAWLLGIDVGSVHVKVVLCEPNGKVVWGATRPAQGRPLTVAVTLLQSLEAEVGKQADVRVSVTGSGRELVAAAGMTLVVNEVVAAARGARALVPDATTVVDLGGQFSKWIRLDDGDDAGVRDFAANGLCAAGSGAFVEQQAARMGMDAARLGCVAEKAGRAATIAGRCSVFAKSDMIHLQQKGTPTDEIALGLCHAMVRTFLGTVVGRTELEPPVVLVGGGGANPGIARAFREVAHLDAGAVRLVEQPERACALGAALASREAQVTPLGRLLEALTAREAGGAHRSARVDALAALPRVEEAVGKTEQPPSAREGADVVLGVDVGSVSTNLVVVTLDGELVHGEYLATRGCPTEVLQEGMRAIEARLSGNVRVVGVGTTGSGRHLAAAMLGADVVHNEITAQMVSTLHYVPEADTVFEIGGQDAKYISMREGRLVDFEMNKICSAGTGSFLEEQAQRLGVQIVQEFARHAERASAPCDLGTQCTVFMDAELVRAQQRGAGLDDLCAGLAYSVARNYLDRVVAGRPIGRHVVFQGGTASNRAVVAAFRQLLGREVVVHPYNRLSGALGMALLALEHRKATGAPSRFHGFSEVACPAVRTFECKVCDNRCQVSRVTVGSALVHFGDACERYAERDHARTMGRRAFPELFESRRALLEAHLTMARQRSSRGRRVGLLQASTNLELLPFWATFLAELGMEPVVPERVNARLLSSYPGSVPSEVCLPIKAAVAQARAMLASGQVERVFVPDVMEFPGAGDDEPATSCMYVHHLGDMLRGPLGGGLITAKIRFTGDVLGLVDEGVTLAAALGAPIEAVLRAVRAARIAQASFDEARRELGKRALEADFDWAVVVVGKPYNTHDPFLNLSLARHLDRLGMPAIPWDLMPYQEVTLPSRWRELPWRFNRDQFRVLSLTARNRRLFPIWVSSFGCGPDGFAAKHLEALLEGRPRLLLEFDEHRGEAGLVTRLEAFADEIRAYRSRRGRGGKMRSVAGRPEPNRGRFLIPRFSDHARIYDAVLRSAGFEVVTLPDADGASLRLGEEQASGRECHPYAVLLGDLVRAARSGVARERDMFFFPRSENPCLIHQYGDGMRFALLRLGARAPVVWDARTEELTPLVGMSGMFRLYEGLFSVDVLLTLATRLRAYEAEVGTIDQALQTGLAAVEQAVQRRESVADALGGAADRLWRIQRKGEPWDRPVVGVTGDVFTRSNAVENAGLWRRLESMGCEVWPSPYLVQLADLGTARLGRTMLRRLELRNAAGKGLTLMLAGGVRHRLLSRLPVGARDLVEEPSVERLLELASPYLDEWSSPFVIDGVGKAADFLQRGATGVVSAVGLNCMAGVTMAAVMPTLRQHNGDAPVLTLSCGGTEGPAQRIRLETFVEQVRARWRRTMTSAPGRARGIA